MTTEKVDFEDVASDRGDLDTFSLAGKERVWGLENLVDSISALLTAEIYEDDKSDLHETFALATHHLLSARALIDSLLAEASGKYKIRNEG